MKKQADPTGKKILGFSLFGFNYTVFLLLLACAYLWLHLGYQDYPEKPITFLKAHSAWLVLFGAMMALLGVKPDQEQEGWANAVLQFIVLIMDKVFKSPWGLAVNFAALCLFVFLFYEFRFVRLTMNPPWGAVVTHNGNDITDEITDEPKHFPCHGTILLSDKYGIEKKTEISLKESWNPVAFLLGRDKSIDFKEYNKDYKLKLTYIDGNNKVEKEYKLQSLNENDTFANGYPSLYAVFQGALGKKGSTNEPIDYDVMPLVENCNLDARRFKFSVNQEDGVFSLIEKGANKQRTQQEKTVLVTEIYQDIFTTDEKERQEELARHIEKVGELLPAEREEVFDKLWRRIRDRKPWDLSWPKSHKFNYSKFFYGFFQHGEQYDDEVIKKFVAKSKVLVHPNTHYKAIPDLVQTLIELTQKTKNRQLSSRIYTMLAGYFETGTFKYMGKNVAEHIGSHISFYQQEDDPAFVHLIWALGHEGTEETKNLITHKILKNAGGHSRLNHLAQLVDDPRTRWPKKNSLKSAERTAR